MNIWLVEPALLVAVTVKLYPPTVLGVPEMTPVLPTSVSPPGSAPAMTAYVAT